MTAATFRIDDLEIDMRLREVRRGATAIRLQAQPFDILAMLLEHGGEVVTREQLRQRLWPDGTSVDFEHSLNAAIKRLRAALGDDAAAPRYVETLPRRGYRFIGRPDPANRRDDRAAGGQARPRLAVSPFVTFADGDGAADGAFSRGLMEELVAQLARRCADRVGILARLPSAPRPGEPADPTPVDYLVVGSVRPAGDRVRIVARLVDRRDGTHRWAHAYDGASGDPVQVQAEVAAQIAEAVATLLITRGVDARGVQPRPAPVRHDASAFAARLGLRRWTDPPVRAGVLAAQQTT
jgi:DNA-binding winged helix-turn-helix (wHTH) protein